MTSKLAIVEELGERALLLPDLLNRALEANDRAKFALTLFQSAEQHARQPGGTPADLRPERERLGLDRRLDDVVGGSRRTDGGDLLVPGAAELHDLLVESIEAMIRPLAEEPGELEPVRAYRKRLEALASAETRPVFDAIERAGDVHVRYGQRLDEVLGRQEAVAFLRTVMETSSRGLAEGRKDAEDRMRMTGSPH